jgi:hypothetical protein
LTQDDFCSKRKGWFLNDLIKETGEEMNRNNLSVGKGEWRFSVKRQKGKVRREVLR